jgi:hypothetical protein
MPSKVTFYKYRSSYLFYIGLNSFYVDVINISVILLH